VTVLRGDRVVLRPWLARDLDALAAHERRSARHAERSADAGPRRQRGNFNPLRLSGHPLQRHALCQLPRDRWQP
jgi:hypothetical protein